MRVWGLCFLDLSDGQSCGTKGHVLPHSCFKEGMSTRILLLFASPKDGPATIGLLVLREYKDSAILAPYLCYPLHDVWVKPLAHTNGRARTGTPAALSLRMVQWLSTPANMKACQWHIFSATAMR